MNNILKAQESLYIWLASFEKRSYDMIRQSCDYLNVQYGLGIENNAVWKIFYPLVYSGVVDHIGKGYFALNVLVFHYLIKTRKYTFLKI